ncbi:MAG: hypothetical protein ABI683_10790 [Ginsengibacter sp.]
MKKLIVLILVVVSATTFAQSPKTELYDLIRKFLYDSTGYSNVGDWAVGEPKKFPVEWKADRIEMSEDTSINFFRLGSANVTIRNKSFMQNGQPVKWNVMLKGPRMGYTSFGIISSPGAELPVKLTLDSIFGKKPFTAKLLKSCDSRTLTGYYYYELKLPKKDLAYIKLSWLSIKGNTAIRIDVYDADSQYAAKLDCPK